MSKQYGLPYMGSKSKIADKIVSYLPSAEYFVDLFAGGCAMTHCAMKSGKYSKFVCNDITDAPHLFLDALQGKYNNENRWISREDFFKLKDSDPFVRICWSFGNDQKSYLYGQDIEPIKKALHWAVYYRDAKPLNDFGYDVSEAMVIDDIYSRWLAVKHICTDNQSITPPHRICNTLLHHDCSTTFQSATSYFESFARQRTLFDWRLQEMERCTRLRQLQIYPPPRNYRETT